MMRKLQGMVAIALFCAPAQAGCHTLAEDCWFGEASLDWSDSCTATHKGNWNLTIWPNQGPSYLSCYPSGFCHSSTYSSGTYQSFELTDDTLYQMKDCPNSVNNNNCASHSSNLVSYEVKCGGGFRGESGGGSRGDVNRGGAGGDAVGVHLPSVQRVKDHAEYGMSLELQREPDTVVNLSWIREGIARHAGAIGVTLTEGQRYYVESKLLNTMTAYSNMLRHHDAREPVPGFARPDDYIEPSAKQYDDE